ncbi:MAG: glycoside hydrolase family 25 [Ruminococcus sp.]|nr:glycoside hydrolase family 25 [Ruminococcus sp.]
MKTMLICLPAALLMLSACGDEIETAKVTKQTTAAASQTTTAASTTVTTTTATAATTAKAPEKKKEELTLEYKTDLEVFEKITLGELITKTNAEINAPDTVVDTNKVGEQKIKVSLTLNGEKQEKELTCTVTDRTAPVFLSGDYISVPVGSTADLSEVGLYADNYDPYPTLSVSESVDTSYAGTHQVQMTLSDSSGNTDTRTVTVEVVEQVSSFIQPDNGSLSFSDDMAMYQGGGADVGIDVSAWQGVIDFNAVASEGCNFVMIRAAHCSGGYNMGVDDYFPQNLDNALSAGLDCGVYFYSADNDPEEVRAHAQWLVDTLAGRELAMPIAFDWEDFWNFRSYGMSLHDLNELYRVFKEVVEGAGYRCMLYGSRNFLKTVWDTDGEDVWLAHYVSQTDYDGQYSLWQTGVGTISGINGLVDLDVRYSH